jgi:hypothetical protein
MNTNTISTGIIAVDYSKSLQNMMADCSYDWVNPAITPKGFPITAVGIVQFSRLKAWDLLIPYRGL